MRDYYSEAIKAVQDAGGILSDSIWLEKVKDPDNGKLHGVWIASPDYGSIRLYITGGFRTEILLLMPVTLGSSMLEWKELPSMKAAAQQILASSKIELEIIESLKELQQCPQTN